MWILWLKPLETLKIGHNLVCNSVKTIFNWVSTSLALKVEFLYILTKQTLTRASSWHFYRIYNLSLWRIS